MDWLQHSVVRGALTGIVAAAAVDYAAFRSWKSFADARGYSWSVAAFRWVQGAITGALAALGLDAAI